MPNSFAYNDDVKPITQELLKAKALLKEAGYDEKNPLVFEVVTNTGNDIRVNTAQILQYQLSKIGVRMKIRVMEWQAFLNTVVHPRKFETVLLGWSLALMPDAYPLWHSSSSKLGGFNLVGYKNEKVEEGPGFPFFLPKGMILRNELMKYWREIHTREGYDEIETPVMLNQSLWVTSGHWAHYQENMYTTMIDDELFCIKPMNCPGSMLIYKSQPRSYKELPMRLAEVGLVHRHEKSGALHGLMRVRCFHQDDAHEYLMPEQVESEIEHIVKLINEVYEKFEFKYHVELSTMPEDHMGSDEDWENATNGLRNALDKMGIPYEVNEGDGAFYGPKIDFHLEDCIGRTWQCGTIQLDFQLPQNFEAKYIGADGEEHVPVMIHRVVFGSVERFIGILTENYAGKFPTWLSPVQVKVLPISDKFAEYAKSVNDTLKKEGIRS